MTGPSLTSLLPMLGSVPHVMSYDEWQQAQYAPHRVGSDPTEPQGPGRILTYDEFDAARRSGSVDTMQFPALPRLPKLTDASLVDRIAPRTVPNPDVPLIPAHIIAAIEARSPGAALAAKAANVAIRQAVNPVLEHPFIPGALAAAPVVLPPLALGALGVGMVGTVGYHETSYLAQKAAEQTLSPEERKLAEADPERISGESAAAQAVMLGLGALVPVAMKQLKGAAPAGALGETSAAAAERVAGALAREKARVPYFQSEQGAEVLGRTAAQNGLSPESSPYPPNSQLDVAWKNGHGETIPIPEAFGGGEMPVTKAVRQALAEKAARGEYDPFGDARSIDRFNAAARTSGETAAEPPPITPGPDEKVPAATATAPAPRQPVQGTGELRTRGLSRGVEEKAIANKLTTTLGDIPEYRTIPVADQAARAWKLITDDPALARKVALGEAVPPADLLPESVFVAVENKAIAEGDVGTLRELASGRLTAQVTEKAQSLRMLRERDPESPVAAMEKVAEARAKGVAKPEVEIQKTVDEMKTHLADATKIEPSAFQKFIDDLRC